MTRNFGSPRLPGTPSPRRAAASLPREDVDTILIIDLVRPHDAAARRGEGAPGSLGELKHLVMLHGEVWQVLATSRPWSAPSATALMRES